MLTIIIPSYNEEAYLPACLDSLLVQTGLPDEHGIEVLIAANGCKDKTVAIAESYAERFGQAGFTYRVMDIAEPGKMNALRVAESHAQFANKAYIDADIVLDATLIRELAELLDRPEPVYASGTLIISPSPSWVTRSFAEVWSRLPFVKDDIPGIGVYAVNAAGRKRWDAFPEITSDDGFVRLNFAPHERLRTRASYTWPLPDGYSRLLNVRRRWLEGSVELAERYPELMKNESAHNDSPSNLLTVLKTPVSGAVFLSIYLSSKILTRLRGRTAQQGWRSGRV